MIDIEKAAVKHRQCSTWMLEAFFVSHQTRFVYKDSLRMKGGVVVFQERDNNLSVIYDG